MSAERLTIADISEVTGTSPKTLRAYLRRNHGRSEELKNSRWGTAKDGFTLSAKLTSELVERFTEVEEEVTE